MILLNFLFYKFYIYIIYIMNRLSEYVSMLKGGADKDELMAAAAAFGTGENDPAPIPQIPLSPIISQIPMDQELAPQAPQAPQLNPQMVHAFYEELNKRYANNIPQQSRTYTQSHMTQPVKESYIPYKRDAFMLYDKPEIYNVFIYKSINGRDMYIGSTTANSSHTIKQILNNFKVSGNVCIVSYETQIVTSLNHQDFDITLDLLHLQFPKIKLYIL